jgi:hypothetical protein
VDPDCRNRTTPVYPRRQDRRGSALIRTFGISHLAAFGFFGLLQPTAVSPRCVRNRSSIQRLDGVPSTYRQALRGKVLFEAALARLPEGGRSGASSEPLCDDLPETDRFRAPGRQHPINDRHADGSLCLLRGETACAEPRSDQRLVAADRRFDERALAIVAGGIPANRCCRLPPPVLHQFHPRNSQPPISHRSFGIDHRRRFQPTATTIPSANLQPAICSADRNATVVILLISGRSRRA